MFRNYAIFKIKSALNFFPSVLISIIKIEKLHEVPTMEMILGIILSFLQADKQSVILFRNKIT